jgi:hypothetical protein
VITGFNTDIEYNGVVYHVQTEDKGLETPLILSLVYSGGEILASKRSPYDDLIQAGFDEKVLTDRLNRQHKLICAAIKQGRVDDLKRMSMREPAARENAGQNGKARKRIESGDAPIEILESVEIVKTVETPIPIVEIVPTRNVAVEPIEAEQPLIEIPVAVVDETDDVQLEYGFDEPLEMPGTPHLLRAQYGEMEPGKEDFEQSTINIKLFEEREYRGGERVELKIQVTNDIFIPLPDVEIMVKVLGSSFRPLIFHARTGKKGTALVNLQLPHFRAGRAALLVRAILEDQEVELRRIINQG